jgi:hypothetical protein
MVAFSLGLSIGERKIRHTNAWCQNYGALFQPRPSLIPGRPFMHELLPPAHGVFGTILSVSQNQLVIQGKDGIEQNVEVTSSTRIRVDRNEGTFIDLQPQSTVSVLGAPNAGGQIEAHLIRVFRGH